MIDSHVHLGDDVLYLNIEAVLQHAQSAGITDIINICTDPLTLERGLLLAQKYPWIHNVASTTPHDAAQVDDAVFDLMAQAARSGKLVAVGETGLEYYHSKETKKEQCALFIRYLQLALETNLPVVIHCREAFSDFFEIIDAHYKKGKGVLHCFTGTLQEAKGVLERGWYLSLSGIVTFKKSEELREVAKIVPIEQLLIETDAPYLAPQKYRGQQNEPAYLIETAQVIAQLRGMDVQELLDQTALNARRLFL